MKDHRVLLRSWSYHERADVNTGEIVLQELFDVTHAKIVAAVVSHAMPDHHRQVAVAHASQGTKDQQGQVNPHFEDLSWL